MITLLANLLVFFPLSFEGYFNRELPTRVALNTDFISGTLGVQYIFLFSATDLSLGSFISKTRLLFSKFYRIKLCTKNLGSGLARSCSNPCPYSFSSSLLSCMSPKNAKKRS